MRALGSVGARIASVLLRAGALTLVYRELPSCKVSWRNAWPAGLLAAILISSGQILIGLYISLGSVRSAFGTAASVIVLLLSQTNKGNQIVWTFFKSSKACLSLSVMDTSPRRSHTLGS